MDFQCPAAAAAVNPLLHDADVLVGNLGKLRMVLVLHGMPAQHQFVQGPLAAFVTKLLVHSEPRVQEAALRLLTCAAAKNTRSASAISILPNVARNIVRIVRQGAVHVLKPRSCLKHSGVCCWRLPCASAAMLALNVLTQNVAHFGTELLQCAGFLPLHGPPWRRFNGVQRDCCTCWERLQRCHSYWRPMLHALWLKSFAPIQRTAGRSVQCRRCAVTAR